jgi:hypothetical protein
MARRNILCLPFHNYWTFGSNDNRIEVTESLAEEVLCLAFKRPLLLAELIDEFCLDRNHPVAFASLLTTLRIDSEFRAAGRPYAFLYGPVYGFPRLGPMC